MTVSLRVEIRPEVDPIAGWIAVAGSARRPFSGWLELIAAVADAIGEPSVGAGESVRGLPDANDVPPLAP